MIDLTNQTSILRGKHMTTEEVVDAMTELVYDLTQTADAVSLILGWENQHAQALQWTSHRLRSVNERLTHEPITSHETNQHAPNHPCQASKSPPAHQSVPNAIIDD